MSRVLTVKRGGGRGFALLVALLAAIALFHETLARPLGGPAERLQRLLGKTSAWNLGACLCGATQEVTVVRDDGLKLAASLYTEDATERRPAIVLLHGNTPRGRRLPLYKVLASGLAERGYVVLALDRAGFGESEDPFKTAAPGDPPDTSADVSAALAYLEGLEFVAPERIHLVGHSGGVPPVLSAGPRDARARKLVAIGPPRRMAERLADPADRKQFRDRARANREILGFGPFPAWYTEDVWRRHKQSSSELGNYAPYFASRGHKPLLLMDGARESPADRRYLQSYFREMADPKRYVTVPNADHYANTTGIRAVTVYERQVLSYTLDAIDGFLRE
jgi:pimeloyl-ACP methyl ester carboxylesterase